VDVVIDTNGQWPEAVEGLLRGLPDWFGIEASLLDYVDNSRTLPTTTAQLVARVEAGLRAAGVALFQVKTFGPSGDSDEYERTRAFYEAYGFIPLEELLTLWSPGNPCLILVKPLV
jgi:hypothetical protein